VPKNKLKKFAEINSFANVIQPPTQSGASFDNFPFKGNWNKSFFRNSNPIILEIGCGKGEYTLALGNAFPDNNFIGIDIKGDRIWHGARKALNDGLPHIAFLRTQAEMINNFFEKDEISGIWLTFPDPFERKSKAKKRLTSPQFLERYEKILKPESPIHLKTDNIGLFEYTLSVIQEYKHKLLTHSFNLYNDKKVVDPLLKEIQTYYEKIFLKEGKPIHYVKFSLNADKP
jgi:tRNA (guanine-N7-)-methyltransferase